MGNTVHTSNSYTLPPRSGAGARIRKLCLRGAVILSCVVLAIFFYECIVSRSFRETMKVIITCKATPGRAFPGRSKVNILVAGRDLDRDSEGKILNTNGRMDAMMLIQVDFKDRRACVLSIPRDTLVHIPGYSGKRRISYANSYGGPTLAVKTVSKFLGVTPDYYVVANFDGFAKGIDTIGGLEICVDKQLDYDDNWGNLHIHLKPGKQHLNGEQAMGFVRYRQSNSGEGENDLVRIGRQQQMLEALRCKICRPGIVFRVPRMLDAMREDMNTNMTPAQMICVARFIKSLPSDSSIRVETLPVFSYGRVYVKADSVATRRLVAQMFLGN